MRVINPPVSAFRNLPQKKNKKPQNALATSNREMGTQNFKRVHNILRCLVGSFLNGRVAPVWRIGNREVKRVFCRVDGVLTLEAMFLFKLTVYLLENLPICLSIL